MKIPFDITKRPQIESGEYKVETRDGKPVCITCWDAEAINPKEFKGIKILAYHTNSDTKLQFGYNENGKFLGSPDEDLFLVTPEEELSEFEQEVSDMVEYCKEHGEHVAFDYAKRHAQTLLALAKKELLSEKMLIEQTYNPDINKAHELGREEGIMFGKAEALKNLPRWIDNWDSLRPYKDISGLQYIVLNGKAMNVSDLSKLPRFKEDE